MTRPKPHNAHVLLTDALIEELHGFRLEMMRRSVARSPETSAGIEIGGGYARFAGDGSPLTQAYGLGHRGAEVDLQELDAFYDGKTTNWELILTPFASESFLRSASGHGYVADHFGWWYVFMVVAVSYVLCALTWFGIDCTLPIVEPTTGETQVRSA